MRVALTGATGYLGSHLLEALLDSDAQVCAIVRAGDARVFPAGVMRVEDPGSAAELASALGGFEPDVAIHLAACQDLTDRPDASDALVEANLAFGARVLSAACQAGARAFVAAGTYSTHAEGTQAYVPQTLYSATKHAFTALADHYRVNTAMRTLVLELSDTYGPGDARGKFLDLVHAAAISGETLGASPGEQVVSPVHVSDAVAAFIHAARLLLDGADPGAVRSVSGAQSVTLRELVTRYEQATGRGVPVQWGARPYRPREIMSPWAGEPLPGWQPQIDLTEGLARTYGRPDT